MQRAYTKSLSITGNYNTAIEFKTINKLPELQDQYVQGRSVNGNLVWRGAETNELFSYGPVINGLEFDGSNYVYDVNGRLVPLNTGNGIRANNYDSKLFRTANMFSQSLMMQARYQARDNQYLTRVKLGKSDENTVIENNRNTVKNISAFFEAKIKVFTFSASFTNISEKFSNTNRVGFLNRVYQNAMLTPASFDNRQGSMIGTAQRSYSNKADNPFFLLQQSQNPFFQSQNTGSLVIIKRIGRMSLRINQSYDNVAINSNEGYSAGTAFFPNGVFANRIKKDDNYTLNANTSLETKYGGYDFKSKMSFNYIFSNAHSTISYPATQYTYRRSTNDLDLGYQTSFEGSNTVTPGINLSNKFYISNTALKNDFFLPAVTFLLDFHNLFNANGLSLRLVTGLNHFKSELPLSTSFSQNGLTRLNSAQVFTYFPVEELNSFANVFSVDHKERTVKAEFNFKNKLSLSADLFNRIIRNDLFPVYSNGAIVLKNIADHRHTGIEMTASYQTYGSETNSSSSLSFSTYNDFVTSVRDGYNFTAIAGFNNVNKAIVEGASLGSIVGNSFMKDENGKLIIGSDGYPLVNQDMKVIGDPIPDFIMKLGNTFTWKRFSINMDWEWRKGGDVWNGTQAVLDYYGRSATSGQLRNTTDFVFDGVLENGHVNNIPVNFYDPAQPFLENRWVRYGYSGVAAAYIQKGSSVRINNLGMNYKYTFKKYIQSISLTAYTNNLVVWRAYKGVDPSQLLHDQGNASGLDFFNLPSLKSFGFIATIQF